MPAQKKKSKKEKRGGRALVIERARQKISKKELAGHCQRFLRMSKEERAANLLLRDPGTVIASAYYAQIDESELQQGVAAAKKMAISEVRKKEVRTDCRAKASRVHNALKYQIKVTSAELQGAADARANPEAFLRQQEYIDGHPCSAPNTLLAAMTAKQSLAKMAEDKEVVMGYMPKGRQVPNVVRAWTWRRMVPFAVSPCRGIGCSCGQAPVGMKCLGFVCVAPHPDDGLAGFGGEWAKTVGIALPFLESPPLVYRMAEGYNHEERAHNRAERRREFVANQ